MVSLSGALEAPSGPEHQEENPSPLALGTCDEPQPRSCLSVALYFLSLFHPPVSIPEGAIYSRAQAEPPASVTAKSPNPLL